MQIDQGAMFCIHPKKNIKKEPGQYSAILTEEASTVKDLQRLWKTKVTFFLASGQEIAPLIPGRGGGWGWGVLG